MSVPAANLKRVTDAIRTTGEKAVLGQQAIAECAFKQVKENFDALFGTMKTISVTINPVDAGGAYLRFLAEMSQKHMRHAAEIGELVARSSKNSWQPMADVLVLTSGSATALRPSSATVPSED
ncbi:MAG: phasin family protein [Janthinobacterium lividum]